MLSLENWDGGLKSPLRRANIYVYTCLSVGKVLYSGIPQCEHFWDCADYRGILISRVFMKEYIVTEHVYLPCPVINVTRVQVKRSAGYDMKIPCV